MLKLKENEVIFSIENKGITPKCIAIDNLENNKHYWLLDTNTMMFKEVQFKKRELLIRRIKENSKVLEDYIEMYWGYIKEMDKRGCKNLKVPEYLNINSGQFRDKISLKYATQEIANYRKRIEINEQELEQLSKIEDDWLEEIL